MVTYHPKGERMRSLCAVVALGMLVLAGQAQACANRILGAYLVNILNSDTTLASRSVIAVNDGGTMAVIDSNQGGIPDVSPPFTAALGSWECAASDTIAARVLDFSVPLDGSGAGLARVDYVLTIAHDGSVTGTAALRFFALTADPQVSVPPAATFSVQGVRLTVR
jgi:hypothetical protein